MRLFNDMVTGILHCDKPVICRVNGMRIAGGQEIGMACDFTVASDLAVFGQAGPRHGSAPDGGSTDFLPLFVGIERAMESCTLCETWTAYQAERYGLIHDIVPVLRVADGFVTNPLVVTDRWLDENGRVVEANHQADRLLPDDQSWFGRRLADHAVVGEKLPVGRHTLELRHDGTPVDAAVHAIPSADGPLKVVVLRDTVEQRRAADALRDLNDQLRQRVDELGVLSRENALLGELGAFLQASRDRGEVYAVVKRFALELFPGSGALYTLEEGELELRAQWGSSTLPAHPEARGCWSLRRGEIHACDGPDGLPCTHAEDHDGPSVCIPVMSSTGPVALVHLRLPAGAVWSDRSERLLRALADRLGAALTTLALQQRLLQESIRDPLTRLYNRRYMVETMERELARTRRAGQPLAVVMLDVDRFKRLNDTHGHDVGDRVLQEVARRLAGAVRTEDVVCRYGGEEFVAILPGATLELARARAEAFRLQLASGIGSNLPTVTISAGVAMSRDAQSPERLLRLADEALLEAKRSGRDRVIVADQGSETRSLRLAADQST